MAGGRPCSTRPNPPCGSSTTTQTVAAAASGTVRAKVSSARTVSCRSAPLAVARRPRPAAVPSRRTPRRRVRRRPRPASATRPSGGPERCTSHRRPPCRAGPTGSARDLHPREDRAASRAAGRPGEPAMSGAPAAVPGSVAGRPGDLRRRGRAPLAPTRRRRTRGSPSGPGRRRTAPARRPTLHPMGALRSTGAEAHRRVDHVPSSRWVRASSGRRDLAHGSPEARTGPQRRAGPPRWRWRGSGRRLRTPPSGPGPLVGVKCARRRLPTGGESGLILPPSSGWSPSFTLG